jgi:hypothetical protein
VRKNLQLKNTDGGLDAHEQSCKILQPGRRWLQLAINAGTASTLAAGDAPLFSGDHFGNIP